jgi:GT2 family glycosyltransferase
MQVIIPAHNEATTIGSLLSSLTPHPELSIVVVCNGCIDETASVARSHGVQVVEIEEASKTAALTAGDAATKGWPRAYIDADVDISGTALVQLEKTMDETGALAGSLRVQIDGTHSSRSVRRYAKVWSALPQIQEGLAGRGVYALSEAGRALVGEWPALGDDCLVERRIPVDQRVIIDEAATVTLPRSVGELIRQKARVHRGNRMVQADHATGHSSGLSVAAREKRASAFDIATYAALTALAKARSRWGATAWSSPTRLSTDQAWTDRPLLVTIVAYRSSTHITTCLDGIQRAIQGLERTVNIVVVDNNSGDDTLELALDWSRRSDANVNLTTLPLPRNVGFAAACNVGAATHPEADVVLVNPDLILEPGAITSLVEARRSSGNSSAIWGGVRIVDGRPTTGSTWKFPTVWRTIALAVGVQRIPFLPSRLHPEEIAPPVQGHVAVDVISGALLYIPRQTWDLLNGFDQRFFMYSEDVDLARRAADLGIDRLVTADAHFEHAPGASSATSGAKFVLVLAGKITYAHIHGGRVEWILRSTLVASVAIRSLLVRMSGQESRWRDVWRDRDQWISGYLDASDCRSAPSTTPP